jgi:hypothetical protein
VENPRYVSFFLSPSSSPPLTSQMSRERLPPPGWPPLHSSPNPRPRTPPRRRCFAHVRVGIGAWLRHRTLTRLRASKLLEATEAAAGGHICSVHGHRCGDSSFLLLFFGEGGQWLLVVHHSSKISDNTEITRLIFCICNLLD